MTLTQLKYIVAVDNQSNFASAAATCFVTQPTLSMQIQKLEEELDVIIFDRSKQPVTATDIGRKIIDQARTILRESFRIEDIIKSEKKTISGNFRLGIIPTVAPYLMPLFIESFVNKYDGLNLIIDEIQTNEIIAKLKKDELDAAILATPLSVPEFREVPLYYEPFVGYVSKGHKLYQKNRIQSAELDLEDLWLLKEGHCFRDQVMKICSSYISGNNENIKLKFDGGTLDTLMKLVEHNFGMTLVPYLLSEELKKGDQNKYLREFEPPVPKREISVVFQRAYLKKQIIEALIEEIKKSLPETVLDKESGFIVEG